MNRTSLSKKNLNKQRPWVDRFIHPRENLPELCRKLNWDAHEKGTVDEWSKKYLQQKRYINYLDSTFELELISNNSNSEPEQDKYMQLWPCVPRKRGYLSSADSILDLPTYSYAPFPELLDWSTNNILIAALGRQYHKWSWCTQSQVSQGVTDNEIQCCKFDPKGRWLIFGTDKRIVEMHNAELGKRVHQAQCVCLNKPTHRCAITALDWSPTGESFITGCSQGTLVSFALNALPISYNWSAPRGAIHIVRVSPDARYVTATTINDYNVLLFTWPHLQLFSVFKSNCIVKTLAWHPWRSALLGIGAVSWNLHSRITIWNAPTGEVRKRLIHREHCSLDAMLFSKRTGELVLSLWNTGVKHISIPAEHKFTRELMVSSRCIYVITIYDQRGSYTRRTSTSAWSQLVVMSDADNVVDQWGDGRVALDRVRSMIFSPDGSKLATATAAEDLIIWKFLPEDKKNKYTSCKRFSAIPVYLDKTVDGSSVR